METTSGKKRKTSSLDGLTPEQLREALKVIDSKLERVNELIAQKRRSLSSSEKEAKIESFANAPNQDYQDCAGKLGCGVEVFDLKPLPIGSPRVAEGESKLVGTLLIDSPITEREAKSSVAPVAAGETKFAEPLPIDSPIAGREAIDSPIAEREAKSSVAPAEGETKSVRPLLNNSDESETKSSVGPVP